MPLITTPAENAAVAAKGELRRHRSGSVTVGTRSVSTIVPGLSGPSVIPTPIAVKTAQSNGSSQGNRPCVIRVVRVI
jgi:hypothetical protein